jgi:hypothetical protein
MQITSKKQCSDKREINFERSVYGKAPLLPEFRVKCEERLKDATKEGYHRFFPHTSRSEKEMIPRKIFQTYRSKILKRILIKLNVC